MHRADGFSWVGPISLGERRGDRLINEKCCAVGSPKPALIMYLSAGLVNGKSERGNFSDNYRRYFTTKRALCFE